MTTSILSIPAELRLQIYSYLWLPVFELDLCKGITEDRVKDSASQQRRSPLLTYLQKRGEPRQWSRNHGLHLLATHRFLAQEYMDLLNHGSLIIFHCVKCLARLLTHLRIDLGLQQPIFKNIRIKIDPIVSTIPNGSLIENTFAAFRSVFNRFYGAFNIICDESEQGLCRGPDRKWVLEMVCILGKLPKRSSSLYEAEIGGDYAGSSDDEDEADQASTEYEGFEDMLHHWWHPYTFIAGVKILRTVKKTFDIHEHDERPICQAVIREMMSVRFTSRDDAWRPARYLMRPWFGSDKNNRKNLVHRNEIWIGLELP